MDKMLRNITIVGIIIVVSSIVYYIVYLPHTKQRELKKCLEIAENDYSRSLDTFGEIAGKDFFSEAFIKFIHEAEEEKEAKNDKCYQRYK